MENVKEVGTFGGSCTCPDGRVHWVGDNMDACDSLACINGIAGECKESNVKGAKRKVVCASNAFTITSLRYSVS